MMKRTPYSLTLFLGVFALAGSLFGLNPGWMGEANASNGAILPGASGESQGGNGSNGSLVYVEPTEDCGGWSPCYAVGQDAVDSASGGSLLLISDAEYEEDIVIDLDGSFALGIQPGWNPSFTQRQTTALQVSSDSLLGTTFRSITILKGSLILEGDEDLTDSDGDGLIDTFETNTGVFVSASDTGTDPNDPDTDGDNLSDGDEVLGTLDGLDLPAMGANPLRKNLLLEYDWFDDALECAAHTHRPTAAMVNRVSAAFAAAPVANPDGSTGVTLIHDYGQGGLFDGGNLISDPDGVLIGGVNSTEFKTHKLANFDDNRHGYFYYVILPHRYNTDSTSSGQAELPGDDMIVSLYCYAQNTVFIANTIMHELGHNLSLRHGGSNNCNYKPNYNSVMNYRYQFGGVDNDCTPPGNSVLDYSIGDRIPLDETSLFEDDGICGAPLAWDWNGNDSIDAAPVAVDVNSSDSFQGPSCGGILTVLEDSDDWASIQFTGLNNSDGAPLYRVAEVIDCDNAPPQAPFSPW